MGRLAGTWVKAGKEESKSTLLSEHTIRLEVSQVHKERRKLERVGQDAIVFRTPHLGGL